MIEISSLVVKEIPWVGASNRSAGSTISVSVSATNDSQRLQVKLVGNLNQKYASLYQQGRKKIADQVCIDIHVSHLFFSTSYFDLILAHIDSYLF